MTDNPYDAPQSVGTTPVAVFSGNLPPSTGLAVASMVLGISAIVFNCCCTPLGIALGVPAVITGLVALNKVKNGTGAGKGMAIAGSVCGIVAVVMGIGLLILSLVIQMPNFMEAIEQMQRNKGR